MENEELFYQNLMYELEGSHGDGICLFINDTLASPMAIAAASYVADDTADYMRDYIFDENGVVTEIHFDIVTRDRV